jgi:hypothetical protein
MRAATGTIATDIQGTTTTLARLVQFTRDDGTVVRFTDHDQDITVSGDCIQATDDLNVALVAGGPLFATGTLIMDNNSNNAADTETVTINGKVYTFQTVLTNVDGHVLVGANQIASLSNLAAAINLGAGAGTLYAAATVLNPDVTAVVHSPNNARMSNAIAIAPGDGFVASVISNVTTPANVVDGDPSNDAHVVSGSQGIWAGYHFNAPQNITHAVITPPTVPQDTGFSYKNADKLTDWSGAGGRFAKYGGTWNSSNANQVILPPDPVDGNS